MSPPWALFKKRRSLQTSTPPGDDADRHLAARTPAPTPQQHGSNSDEQVLSAPTIRTGPRHEPPAQQEGQRSHQTHRRALRSESTTRNPFRLFRSRSAHFHLGGDGETGGRLSWPPPGRRGSTGPQGVGDTDRSESAPGAEEGFRARRDATPTPELVELGLAPAPAPASARGVRDVEAPVQHHQQQQPLRERPDNVVRAGAGTAALDSPASSSTGLSRSGSKFQRGLKRLPSLSLKRGLSMPRRAGGKKLTKSPQPPLVVVTPATVVSRKGPFHLFIISCVLCTDPSVGSEMVSPTFPNLNYTPLAPFPHLQPLPALSWSSPRPASHPPAFLVRGRDWSWRGTWKSPPRSAASGPPP